MSLSERRVGVCQRAAGMVHAWLVTCGFNSTEQKVIHELLRGRIWEEWAVKKLTGTRDMFGNAPKQKAFFSFGKGKAAPSRGITDYDQHAAQPVASARSTYE